MGREALTLDRTMRVLGIYRSAQRNYANLDPASRRALESYAAGVNAFVARRDFLLRPLPPEFIVLGAKPEPWTPADSLVWAKTLAFDLSVNMSEELLRAHLAQILDPQQLADIYPRYPHPEAHELGALSDLYASIPWGAGVARSYHERRSEERLEQLGRRRRSLGYRQAHPGQRPPSRTLGAVALVSRPLGSAGTGRDRRDAAASPRRGARSQRSRGVGLHEHLRRCPGRIH